MIRRACSALIPILLAFSSAAWAARDPEPMQGHPYFEVATGDAARVQRSVVYAPTWRSPAWDAFQAMAGGEWRGIWDADTRVPLAIYGSGIASPGAVDSADAAARLAETYLAQHLALLAPGAKPSDFALAGNRVRRGVRTVVFSQFHRDLPVVGGSIGFTFKRDRLIALSSTAWPNIDAVVPRAVASTNTSANTNIGPAENRALEWIREDAAFADARVLAGAHSVVLPIVRLGRAGARIEYAVARVVTVSTAQNPGLWNVYVDAGADEGRVIAREQRLRFGSGTVRYNTPVRWPGGARTDAPAPFADLTVNGSQFFTDAGGTVTWGGAADAALTARARGSYVRVANQAGGDAAFSDNLANGGVATWALSGDPLGDAQVTTFVHANLAKQYARTIDPELGWLDDQLLARANINQACNAYYDPQDDSINFFIAGTAGTLNCDNTGRLPDVIYHEFGHALHNNTVTPGVPVDIAFSEGLSDYYAATINNDPAMGIGFFGNGDPLRHIDPPGVDSTWPDDIDQDPHITGLIFAEAMWDLRKQLIAALGQEAGVAYADRLFYAAVQNAPDIPGSYAAIIAEDDDDGNLANGTPAGCLIDEAFALHGLSSGSAVLGSSIDDIVQNGQEVSFRELPSPNALCPTVGIAGATLEWQVRDEPAMNGSAPMIPAGDRYAATIPFLAEPLVVLYRVTIQYQGGSVAYYPNNAADPMYEMFQGGVIDIYCTDFESDPFAQGWTSGSSAGVDDWRWGSPSGAGEDPALAFSGSYVLGNNLAGDGRYSSESFNYIDTPTIDVSGYDNVRLQYRRWLYVEDGYWDHGVIQANGTSVWTNADSQQGDNNSNVHHTDREWRFHDIDVTELDQDGTMQIRFSLESDQALEFGGWTLDDVCLVSYVQTVCGDSLVTSLEECDDGTSNSDIAPDACRTDCLAAYCGDGVTDSAEQCDDGNNVDDDGCANDCLGQINAPLIGDGCCNTNRAPSPGAPVLWLMVCLGLFAALRRRGRDA